MKKINWKKMLPHVIAVVIFLLIAVIYCKPALEGKVLSQSDITQWKAMAAQSFKYKETHGHFPLWTNSAFAGMPAYQIAMESSNPISIGFLHNVFTLFLPTPVNFFFLMCISFYFLTQVFKIDYRLGILGSIGYAYASFSSIIIEVGHNTQVLAMGYVPALLGAVFLVFQKRYLIGGALTAVLSGLLIAQNHLQITYYFALIALFAGVAYLIYWLKQKQYRHIILSLAILAVAGAIGIGINSVTLITTIDFSKETMRNGTLNLDASGNETRKSSGLPIDYAFQWSYGKAESFTMLVPNIYGGSSDGNALTVDSHVAKSLIDKGVPDDQATQIAASLPTYWGAQPNTSGPVYLGAVMCFLFLFGMIYLKGFDKWWILAICVFAVVMSWGSNLMGFNTFLFNNMPLYNKFRAPTMALYIPQLLFPLLSIMALQQFIFKEKDKAFAWKKLKITGYAVAGIFAIVALMYTGFDYKSAGIDGKMQNQFNSMLQGNKEAVSSLFNAVKEDRKSLFGSDILRSALFVLLAFACMWLLLKDKIKPVYGLAAILLLSSIDVLAEGRRYLNDDMFVDGDNTETTIQPTAADLQIMKDTGYYRVLNLTTAYFQDATTSNFHNAVGGYSPAKLSLIEDLLTYQLSGSKGENPAALDMLNVKWVIVPGPQNQPQAQMNPGVLGACWFVKGINFVNGPAEAMKALNNFSPKDTAVMENSYKSAIPFTPSADSTASIQLVKNDNDLITYKSSAKTTQLAIFSEIFYDRGWKAYVDNKETPILKADYALRAMVIPAGSHDIRFEFKPASYYESSTIAVVSSALAWLVLIGSVVVVTVRKMKTA